MHWCHAVRMRTSISLDDRLVERVRRGASDEGISVNAFIARILDDVLKRQEVPAVPPFRLVTVAGEGVYPDIDLDRRADCLFDGTSW